MFTCRCLNVSIVVNDESAAAVATTNNTAADSGPAMTPKGAAGSGRFPRPSSASIARLVEGKSRELANFFQAVFGPLQEISVTVQLAMMMKTIPCDGWLVSSCQNCGIFVFARDALNPTSLLVNGTLEATQDTAGRLMAQENYSPAYRIVLEARSADFRGFYRKDQYRSLFTAAANTLDSTNDRNELLESLRAFMRTETQLANERIARFTAELNEQLTAVRDRAEQDYLFLAQTFVPDHPYGAVDGNKRAVDPAELASPTPKAPLEPLLTGLMTPGAPSQMETPPPTPECMPMSTGNSPPSIANGNGTTASPVQKQQRATVGDTTTSGGVGFKSVQRPALSSSAANTINNNHTTNSNHGAINKPPAQQQQQQQHSTSTNLFANHGSNILGATTTPTTVASAGITAGSVGSLVPGVTNRFKSSSSSNTNNGARQTTMFDSDCLFEIDGMENDQTPPPDDFSDEEECDSNDALENNNRSEGGIFIPRQHGRPSVSIAKSLPISMPKNMAPYRANEDDLDEMIEDGLDIPASIKALAKSVHGEAVFGDLPRRQIQKFTTQI